MKTEGLFKYSITSYFQWHMVCYLMVKPWGTWKNDSYSNRGNELTLVNVSIS